MKPLKADVFYNGETIDLIVPTRELAEKSSWYSWFNSQGTTKYTDHGIFPNTPEQQVAFFNSLSNGSRFALLLRLKNHSEPSGIVSLSSIDFRKRTASLAIITDTDAIPAIPPFAALEAVAAVTEHGFNVMGLRRIESGQVYPALAKWNQMLEIFGYRTEGFRRKAYSRGQTISDQVLLACIFENFEALNTQRENKFWPGAREISQLIRTLPKVSYAEQLDSMMRELENQYFGNAN